MIRVIDLFAGPGGLGEGFSSFRHNGERPFRVMMSVEKEAGAHRTLGLRAFLRALPEGEGREDYDAYLSGRIDRAELEARWPEAAAAASAETLGCPTELGPDNGRVQSRFRSLRDQAGVDDPWVLIGGPPCQAYSLAGRSRNRAKKGYRPEKDDRNFLYREYLKMLAMARPDAFVMENVRGMLSAEVAGKRIFDEILSDLGRPGRAEGIRGAQDLAYDIHSLVVESDGGLEPEDFLIRSEEYGVPQARHRVILLGVRRGGACRNPGILRKSHPPVTVAETLRGLGPLRSRLSRGPDTPLAWEEGIRKGILKLLASDSFIEPGLANMLRDRLDGLYSCLPHESGQGRVDPESRLGSWIQGRFRADPTLVTGNRTRGHMIEDLQRYFFAACWTLCRGESPKSADFPALLAPKHANWNTGSFADRFRVQAGNRPASTITSHISKDGHYFIHHDPLQCRSLTPREAARIQTFPDDYHFEGSQTSQYAQIGNAVPPWLARQIADIVFGLLC